MLGILPALGDVAKLDTLVTVVDGHSMLYELESVQDLKDRGWHATPEDERTVSTSIKANAMTIVGCCAQVSQLLCDQLEFANVIVLNKCDLLSVEEHGRLRNMLQLFNPTAKVPTARTCLDVDAAPCYNSSPTQPH